MAEDLSFENIGNWPPTMKFVFIGICIAAILGVGYMLLIKDQMSQLKSAQAREQSLKREFENKQANVVNLKAYQDQMVQMRKYFEALLELLPKGSEVPDLIDSISRIAVDNGLTTKTFDPQDEKAKDFYIEFPIKMSVVGSYHEIANFISEVSKLPRIVTFHEFSLTHVKKRGVRGDLSLSGSALQLDIVARTYRYKG